jgi:hypothetical protein
MVASRDILHLNSSFSSPPSAADTIGVNISQAKKIPAQQHPKSKDTTSTKEANSHNEPHRRWQQEASAVKFQF